MEPLLVTGRWEELTGIWGKDVGSKSEPTASLQARLAQASHTDNLELMNVSGKLSTDTGTFTVVAPECSSTFHTCCKSSLLSTAIEFTRVA